MIRAFAAALAAALLATPARAAEVAGIALPDRIEVGGSPLVLNGAGLRTRFLLEVYVIGLYVPERTHRAESVLDARAPRRAHLVTKLGVDADTMWDAFSDGIRANATPAELAALAPRLAEVERAFREIGHVVPGDVVDIDFAADGSGEIRFRGERRGAITGADLSRALLKIWLGAKPVQRDLKDALLGR